MGVTTKDDIDVWPWKGLKQMPYNIFTRTKLWHGKEQHNTLIPMHDHERQRNKVKKMLLKEEVKKRSAVHEDCASIPPYILNKNFFSVHGKRLGVQGAINSWQRERRESTRRKVSNRAKDETGADLGRHWEWRRERGVAKRKRDVKSEMQGTDQSDPSNFFEKTERA